MKVKDNYSSLQKIVISGFFFLFVVIVMFLARWQIFESGNFKSQAEQRFTEKSLDSTRGEILSRHGETLAYSDPAWDVYAYVVDMKIAEEPTESRLPIQTRKEFVEKVSSVLGVSEDEITDKIEAGGNWVKLAEAIPYETKIRLDSIPTDRFGEKFTIVGLNYEFTSKRVYPEGNLAPHILGFIGKDLNANDIGRGGLEQKYNGTLDSQEGYIAAELDKYGNTIAFSDSTFIKAKRGSTLKLTMDTTVQKILQRKLCEGVERYQAKSGSAIIMDPRTGEVLALANCPDFDPNKYYEVESGDIFTNSAIVVPYEVGSIAKTFTMASAIELGGIKPDDIIMKGHNGCITIQASNFDENDKREICTADKQPQGPLTATQSLIKSDNIAFVELSQLVGKEGLHEYLSKFGVGKPSGIDLTGESIGYLPDLDNENAWHPVDMAVFSFGHGYQMNLMQATKGIASFANHGWMMRPYIVSEIKHDDGVTKSFDPISEEKVVSDTTAHSVKIMMSELYRAHTSEGYRHLYNYPVATKSGTALIPYKDKVGYSSEVNATYVGFDTSEDPKFIMAIKLEAPVAVKKLSFYSARPLWLETYDELKTYWGIEPVTQ